MQWLCYDNTYLFTRDLMLEAVPYSSVSILFTLEIYQEVKFIFLLLLSYESWENLFESVTDLVTRADNKRDHTRAIPKHSWVSHQDGGEFVTNPLDCVNVLINFFIFHISTCLSCSSCSFASAMVNKLLFPTVFLSPRKRAPLVRCARFRQEGRQTLKAKELNTGRN